MLYPLLLGPLPRNRYEWILSLVPILLAALLVSTTARAAGATSGDSRAKWVGCVLYPLAFVVFIVAGVSMAVQNELAMQMYSGPIQIWFGWRNPIVIAMTFTFGAALLGVVNAVRAVRTRRTQARR